MTSMAIGGNQMPDMSQMRAQMEKMQSFTGGSSNLSLDDFTSMKSDIESSGRATPEDLQAIIENYESIDVNGDGVSFDELTTFAEENGIELGGPFSGEAPGGPGGPGGPPPGGPPPGPPPGEETEQGSESSTSTYLSSLISSFMSSDPQSTTSNFSVLF